MAKQFQLGQQVKFVRVSPEGEVVKGEGMVVGHIICINKRENYQVKEGDRAYNLEPHALDCTDEEEAAYIEHVKKIRTVADDFNTRSAALITEGNAEIDRLNAGFFGPAVID